MFQRVPMLVLVLCLALTVGIAQASTLHPALEDQLEQAPVDQSISVIVHMVEQAPIAQLNETLKTERATRKERHRRVVESLQNQTQSQAAIKSHLDQRIIDGSVNGYTSYWISNMLVVDATKEEILSLAARNDVRLIEPNFTPELIEPDSRPPLPGSHSDEIGDSQLRGAVTPGVEACRAPEVWQDFGLDGTGVLVANLDTGVDGNHPAFNTRWRGYNGAHPWQECWLDVLGTGTTFPNDGNSHGTHVMGTITGDGGQGIGMAPGATWIACNAINQGVGGGFDNDILTAFQWFLDPDGNAGTVDDVPDVVQNSWRTFGGLGYPACFSLWWTVIDNCEAAGVVTIWSAGNEGPGSSTIGSPPDRATTLTNCFSIGAIDATNSNWPYPIANFSSRGPTACDVPADHKIKPEVVAPGVDVYSSIPGGGYQGGWNGTSMSGPHVAGAVALMRAANPDIDVDAIKNILITTARDLGTSGEENTYGWGMIDAYEAVILASDGFGTLEGTVTNASFGNAPIQGAVVSLEDTGFSWSTDSNGDYSGNAGAATYNAQVTAIGFAPAEAEVTIEGNLTTVQDFALTDNAGPVFSDVTDELTTLDETGPYSISADIADFSTVVSASLYYRTNGGPWTEVPMSDGLSVFTGDIPGSPSGTIIDYYLEATDGANLTSREPSNAPISFYTLYVTELAYATEAEDPGDPEWTLGIPEDAATTGVWIRDDPVSTSENGELIQPEDDHTEDPGTDCYVTGNGAPGGGLGDNDVDDGCTTLLSPVFDLSDADFAFLTYHRWYGEGGSSSDDTFVVDVSSDGGVTWTALERVVDMENYWRKITVRLDDYIDLTDGVQVLYRACDLNTPGITEAAIDDFAIEVFGQSAADAPEVAPAGPAVVLNQSQPNPSSTTGTTITFRLSNPSEATLDIFDASGRQVRRLVDDEMSSGAHSIHWDGRDETGNEVSAGVFFYRLKAGAFEQSRRLTIVR